MHCDEIPEAHPKTKRHCVREKFLQVWVYFHPLQVRYAIYCGVEIEKRGLIRHSAFDSICRQQNVSLMSLVLPKQSWLAICSEYFLPREFFRLQVDQSK